MRRKTKTTTIVHIVEMATVRMNPELVGRGRGHGGTEKLFENNK